MFQAPAMAENTHGFPAKLKGSTAARYALAPVCIGVALLVHLSVIGPFLHPTALFLACTVAAAWFGGTGPGFFAAILATLVLPPFVPTRYSLTAGFFDLPRFLAFGITGLAVGWGTTCRRRAEAALRPEPAPKRHEFTVYSRCGTCRGTPRTGKPQEDGTNTL
jgi:Domain of unknown function (DUF4118)